MKKYLGIFILTLLAFTACSKKTFELQNATRKKSIGGTMLSGVSTVYSFELKAQNSWKNVKIDSIYVGNRCFTDISMFIKGSSPGTLPHFEIGDILMVSVTHSKRPATTKSRPPKIIEGKYIESGTPSSRNLYGAKALIIVSLNKKFFEIPVQKISSIKTEIRP